MIYKSLKLTDPGKGDYFYVEALKTLRANIQFSGKNNHVIMVTSTFASEGKSDISFHLAEEMGKAGKKVLLIDADIRKSVYLSRYGIESETIGLSQYLSGQVDNLDELIYKTNYRNVHIILSGPHAPNPSEMLGDKAFGDLLQAARKVYDYVLVDTAPLGVVVDAAVVAQYCDGAIMVVESGKVSRNEAKKVKNQIEKSGCRFIGVVLNKVDTKKSYKYGKYGRYGKYGKYGKYTKYENE